MQGRQAKFDVKVKGQPKPTVTWLVDAHGYIFYQIIQKTPYISSLGTKNTTYLPTYIPTYLPSLYLLSMYKEYYIPTYYHPTLPISPL